MGYQTIGQIAELTKYTEATVYQETIDLRLNAGEFSLIRDHEDFHNFETEVNEEYSFIPCVVRITEDETFSDEEIISLMENEGYRPATFFELLAFRRFNLDKPSRRKLHIMSDKYQVGGGGHKSPTLYKTDIGTELLVAYHHGVQIDSKVLFVKVV